jgi:hypothetical protein
MQMNPAVETKSSKLFGLLQPHRSSDVMQRINLFVVNKTTKKLPEFINNGATDEEKGALLDELISIVEKGEWDKLPAVPNGQATPAQSKPAAIAPQPPKPAVLTPVTPVTPPATPKPAAPIESQPVAVATPQPKAATAPAGGVADQLAALLAQLVPPAAGPSLTETDVRRIVREEMAHVATTVAGVLAKKG